ncbi:hypothetical protein FWK35_00013220, partial [Aphis craccivora]
YKMLNVYNLNREDINLS